MTGENQAEALLRTNVVYKDATYRDDLVAEWVSKVCILHASNIANQKVQKAQGRDDG